MVKFPSSEVKKFGTLNASSWDSTETRILLGYPVWRDAEGYNRKLMLIPCGCVRVGWPKPSPKIFQHALLLVEEKAETGRWDRGKAETVVEKCWKALPKKHNPYAHLVHHACDLPPDNGWVASRISLNADEASIPDGILRKVVLDVIPNPFRPHEIDPGWQSSTVVGIAEQMYVSRDFSAMPILADALQDAGCEDEQILSHCRGEGPHVRGCWVVDLVLGKE
jgi:hypothetical protein